VNGGTATLDDAVVVRALAAGGLAVDGFAGVRLAAAVLCAATGGLGGWLGAALGTALGPLLGPPLGPMLGAGSSGAAGGRPLNRGPPAAGRPPESHALSASDSPRTSASVPAAGTGHRRGIRQA
jgi:hypothetical protein